MPRRPDPAPTTTVVLDTSPEARAQHLKAIKFLLRRIEGRRAQTVEASKIVHAMKL
jgi:hypothetical protein